MAQPWQCEGFTRRRVLYMLNFAKLLSRQTVQQTIATVDVTSCSTFRQLIPYTTKVKKMKYSAQHSLLTYLFIVSSQSKHATFLTTDKAESTLAGYLNVIKY